MLLRKCVYNKLFEYRVTSVAQFYFVLWALIIMQNGQRFVVMYLLYRGSDLLATPEAVAGGDRAEVQEQRDRQDPREGQADAAAAGEVVTARCG